MRRLVLLAFIWGWSFLFIKVAVGGMTPVTVAGARISLGMVVMLAVLRLRRLALPTDLTSWRHFSVMAVVHSAVPFSLLAWGEQHITSALTAVLNAATPLFAAIAVGVALGERLRPSQVVGLVLGFAGVAMAAGLGGEDLASSSVGGALAALGAAACYGLGFAYARRHLHGTPAMVAATGQLVMGSVVTAPFAVATTLVEGIDLDLRRVLAVVALGALGTGVAYVINYQVIATLGPTRASLVTYLVPVVAVTVGVVFLDEPFQLRLVFGGLMTVVGIALLQERVRRHRPAPVLGLVLIVLLLGACGNGGGGSDGSDGSDGEARAPATDPTVATGAAPGRCAPEVQEALDPDSGRHLLPGAPEPSFLSDPPTSGPHRLGRHPTGLLTEPLDKLAQVALLEDGWVLVQHRPDLSEAERTELASLVGGKVTVAPAPALPDRVVATAWTSKQVCGGADLEALRAFVARHEGKGAAGH